MMPDQILPSLQSFGLWSHWLIGLFALLEAVVLTGLVIPGTSIVVAGGMLVQAGVIGFVDLAWFVAAGAALGGEISFRLGRHTEGAPVAMLDHTPLSDRAERLVRRYGGPAIVLGEFTGRMAGFVPFGAARSGMGATRFLLWNLIGAAVYAVVLLELGVILGRMVATLGAAAPRLVAVGMMTTAGLVFLWFVVSRLRRALPLLIAIAHKARDRMAQTGIVRAAIGRHPRLAGFLFARFSTDRFLGLTTTVLAVMFLYVAGVWADSIFDFVGSPDVVSSDSRIANLLYALRDPRLVSILGLITDLGGRHGVLPMLAGFSAALLFLRRYDLLGGLWIAAVGNQITVTLLKSFFARPRSALGYFVETSGSFPSGHAAGATAVWAMLFYLTWRLRILSATVAAFGAVALAFLIGLSRIYLIEHYVSDVLNGYFVGGMFLILGIAFCEWRRRRSRLPVTPVRRRAAVVCVVAGMAVSGYLALTTTTALNEAFRPHLQTATPPAAMMMAGTVPDITETLSGAMRQTIGLIVTAPDTEALIRAMRTAGWQPAPRPGIGTLAMALWDDWTGRDLPHPLIIPTFWDQRPNLLGFADPDTMTTGRMRLHVRFWDSGFRAPDGRLGLIGTVTREDPLNWALSDDAVRLPAPDMANLTARLAAQLQAAGLHAEPYP